MTSSLRSFGDAGARLVEVWQFPLREPVAYASEALLSGETDPQLVSAETSSIPQRSTHGHEKDKYKEGNREARRYGEVDGSQVDREKVDGPKVDRQVDRSQVDRQVHRPQVDRQVDGSQVDRQVHRSQVNRQVDGAQAGVEVDDS
jgi:hypothetical protein